MEQQMPPSPFEHWLTQHVNWVYSAALRQVRDPHLAEDVAQATFLLAARRSESLLQHPKPAGWLFRTVCFCAKEALRRQRRQAHREQEAARMNPEQSPVDAADWPAIAPLLDDAVGELSQGDREAILLRFYQQLPLAQVGQLLRISEEAAKKRVQRALERLRQRLATKGVQASSIGLSAALLANVTHDAPQHLAAIHGASSAATHFATTGQKLLVFAKLKAAAAVLLIGAAAVGTGAAIRPAAAPPTAQAAPPATMPATITLEEDESKVPGQIQLARWDLVLNDEGAKPILEALTPLDTPSKGFQAYRTSGLDLRNAAAEAFAAGGVERVGEAIAHSRSSNEQVFLIGPWGNTLVSQPNTRVGMNFGSSDSETHTRTTTNRIHLALKQQIRSIGVNELTNGWRWTTYPDATIACDTEFAPGDAIAFLGTFPGASGRKYYGLVVWETYSATDIETSRMISIRDARWWCRNGPAKVRQWSNIASVWKAQGTPSTPADLKPFNITLEDGKTARLAALTNPSRWPFCWWDPAGNPATEYNGMASFFAGEPTKGLCAILLVDGHLKEYTVADPTGHPDHIPPTANYAYSALVQIPDADAARHQYEAGVLVGPWTELARMKTDDKVVIGETTYRTYDPRSFGEAAFLVHFDINGPRSDEDVLVAVAGDKQTWRKYSSLAQPRLSKITFAEQPNFFGIPLAEVQYFKLMRRKRQYITLTGFATEPRILPPVTATSDQSREAEKQLALRVEQQRLQKILDARKAWQQTAPDPTTPNGALRALGNAILAKDRPAAESLLLASTPEAKAACRDLIEYMITRQEMYTLVAKRFGEVAIQGKLGGMLGDLDDDWRDTQFKDQPDGSVKAEGLTLRKNPAGEYRFDIDDFAKAHSAQLARYLSTVQRVPDILNSSPTLTVEEFRTALLRPPATQP